MPGYVTYYLLPHDMNILIEYDSLRRVARDEAVSYKTEFWFALLAAPMD